MIDLNDRPKNGISKKWYKKHRNDFYKRVHKNYILKRIGNFELTPVWLDFIKWVIIDLLRDEWSKHKKFGIYQFVALPGEGKTLSMVAHIERDKKTYPNTKVYTNFNYKGQDGAINHWSDMIKYSKQCFKDGVPCILAMDEIHITFDSLDYRNFPAEMLSLISFNRKFGTQFLCSSQIYERIPKKIRDIANYTVLCKNVLKLDRMFIDYYFDTNDYEKGFEGQKRKCSFIRHFVASDELRSKYNTLQQVDRLVLAASAEKTKKQQAFDVLFGDSDTDNELSGNKEA